jgi:hypothetical protein
MFGGVVPRGPSNASPILLSMPSIQYRWVPSDRAMAVGRKSSNIECVLSVHNEAED